MSEFSLQNASAVVAFDRVASCHRLVPGSFVEVVDDYGEKVDCCAVDTERGTVTQVDKNNVKKKLRGKFRLVLTEAAEMHFNGKKRETK